MVALIGTAIERNTMVSSSSEMPTTRMPNGSSAAPSRSEMSIATAVNPVTAVGTPYFSCQCGSSARIRITRSLVAGSSGPVVGTTWTMPIVASSLGVASGTLATPGSARMSSAIPSITPSGSSLVTMVADTTSGPL